MPLTTRRGGTSSDGETSAWTSTSSGRVPSMAARTTEAGLPRRLPDEAGAGVEHLDEPVRAHLEDPGLVRRAEAVLQRPQRAVRALALALELQHAVDEVLEHARAGAPSFVTWPTRRTAIPRALATCMMRAATSRTWPTEPGAPLRSAACRVCTESTTQTSGRSASSVARTSRGRSRPGRGRRARGRRRSEPLGAQADLLGGLLAGDVERRRPAAARLPRAMFVSVDLPMPGEPPRSTREPGTRPPPSTRSSSPMPVCRRGTRGRRRARRDGGRPGPDGAAAAAPPRPVRRRRRGAALLLHERVPGAAARALAVPARRPCARTASRRERSWGGPWDRPP